MSDAENQRQFWVILFDDTEDVAEFGGTVRISAFPSRELAGC